MRTKIAQVLIALSCLLLLSTQAQADADYQCLKLCVQGGHSSSDCMKQCTYGVGPSSTAVKAPVPLAPGLANNRVLPTFQQVDPNAVLHNTKPISSYNESKDYVCVAQCLKTNIGYHLCGDQCTTITKKNGEIIKKPTFKNIPPPVSDNTSQAVTKPW
jgi:hypothetical protein